MIPPLIAVLAAAAGQAAATTFVFFGTGTVEAESGIFVSTLDLRDGTLSTPELAISARRPGFLALHPNGNYLYAIGETTDGGGVLRAYVIDRSNGRLAFLNEQSSGGPGPAHVAVHPDGDHAFVANYTGGTAVVLPIGRDGRLREPGAIVAYEGKSVHPQRQTRPHPHSVNLDPSARFVYVADLGTDRMMIHRFDAADGTLSPATLPFVQVAPGSGPRHFAFHPAGRFAYTLNELTSTVTVFAFDPVSGALSEQQTVRALPPGWTGESTAAEIVVHPGGRFLYTSNRGHDSLAIFALDPDTGLLSPSGHVPSGGRIPRNFAIAPGGRWLLAAHRDTNDVFVYAIDSATGGLERRGAPVRVPHPICVRFLVVE